MNFLDTAIIDFLNDFSRLSRSVDATIQFISRNHLVKGGVLITCFWWVWFRAGRDQINQRVHLVSTLFSCLIAITLARGLALLLPFRSRPLFEQELQFTKPYGVRPTLLEGWSSFPSDHAVLFYALAAGIFYVNKKVGIFAFIYTTLIIAFPRVYLGLHYPTDILGGALIGIFLLLLCNSTFFTEKVSLRVVKRLESKPEIIYPLIILITFQVTDMFSSSRNLIQFIYHISK